MESRVDNIKKRSITKEVRKKIGGKIAIPRVIYTILFGIIICLFIASTIGLFVFTDYSDPDTLMGIMLFEMTIVCVLMFVSIVPMCIRSYFLGKYMRPWIGFKEESILFDEQAIVHKFVDIFSYSKQEKKWLSHKIRYRQVIRIEYDEYQRMLRIYGPRESRLWADKNYTQCVSKVGARDEWKDQTWIEIPEYFNDFELIKNEIEMRTGLTVENKVRTFAIYS